MKQGAVFLTAAADRGVDRGSPAYLITLGVMAILVFGPVVYRPQWVFQLNSWLAKSRTMRRLSGDDGSDHWTASPQTLRIVGVVLLAGGVVALTFGLVRL